MNPMICDLQITRPLQIGILMNIYRQYTTIYNLRFMQHGESYNTPQTYNNSRHKITSSTSIQKWVELYLNPKVYFFLIDIVPQRDFVMINKLTKKNPVDHNRNKIFDGDPK